MKIQITVDDFKTQFTRFTPIYLPLYVAGNTYFNGDIVYYNELFYQCIVENTVELPTVKTDWKLINQDVLNYTRDEDIENAMADASVNFNESLFDDEQAKLIFLYLTAYYLTYDLQNATGAVQTGVITSKSVGSVSESYGIPTSFLNNPMYSLYAKNGYGLKYLSLIIPYLQGNILFLPGATTI